MQCAERMLAQRDAARLARIRAERPHRSRDGAVRRVGGGAADGRLEGSADEATLVPEGGGHGDNGEEDDGGALEGEAGAEELAQHDMYLVDEAYESYDEEDAA
jgi:hypothetical protein